MLSGQLGKLDSFTQRWSATYRLLVWRVRTARSLWSGTTGNTYETGTGERGGDDKRACGYGSMLHWMHRTTADSACNESAKLRRMEKVGTYARPHTPLPM